MAGPSVGLAPDPFLSYYKRREIERCKRHAEIILMVYEGRVPSWGELAGGLEY